MATVVLRMTFLKDLASKLTRVHNSIVLVPQYTLLSSPLSKLTGWIDPSLACIQFGVRPTQSYLPLIYDSHKDSEHQFEITCTQIW
jgi:hypothetical protein